MIRYGAANLLHRRNPRHRLVHILHMLLGLHAAGFHFVGGTFPEVAGEVFRQDGEPGTLERGDHRHGLLGVILVEIRRIRLRDGVLDDGLDFGFAHAPSLPSYAKKSKPVETTARLRYQTQVVP